MSEILVFNIFLQKLVWILNGTYKALLENLLLEWGSLV